MPPHMSEAAPKDGPGVLLGGEHLDNIEKLPKTQRAVRR